MIDEAPLSTPAIVVYSKATGAILYRGPKNAPIPSSDYSWVPLPTGYAEGTHSWNASVRMMVDDLAKVKATTIQRLKDEAEQLKMRSLSPGGAKKEEYAANKAEVRDADQLGGALLTTISTLKLVTGGLEARFPQATANAAAFGDTIPDALNRFRGGIARAAPCPKISAAEAKVCADIRGASTRAAHDAVLAKFKWPAA